MHSLGQSERIEFVLKKLQQHPGLQGALGYTDIFVPKRARRISRLYPTHERHRKAPTGTDSGEAAASKPSGGFWSEKKTCASCSKNSQIEATETTTIDKDYWANPYYFFCPVKINQYACIIPLPWPYCFFFWGGGSGIGRYGVAWVLGRPIQDTLGSSIYRTKMSKKSSCSSTFQFCVSSTMQKTRGFSDVCPTEWASVWMNKFSKFQVGRRCFWNSGGRCCHLLYGSCTPLKV